MNHLLIKTSIYSSSSENDWLVRVYKVNLAGCGLHLETHSSLPLEMIVHAYYGIPIINFFLSNWRYGLVIRHRQHSYADFWQLIWDIPYNLVVSPQCSTTITIHYSSLSNEKKDILSNSKYYITNDNQNRNLMYLDISNESVIDEK